MVGHLLASPSPNLIGMTDIINTIWQEIEKEKWLQEPLSMKE
jgi:hypothetical protein